MVLDDEPLRASTRQSADLRPTRNLLGALLKRGLDKYLLPARGHRLIVCHEPPANCCAGLVLTFNDLWVDGASYVPQIKPIVEK